MKPGAAYVEKNEDHMPAAVCQYNHQCIERKHNVTRKNNTIPIIKRK